MSTPIHISQYPANDIVRKAVLAELNKSSWFARHKASLSIAAGLLLTVLQSGVIDVTEVPSWVSYIISAVTWIAVLFVVAGTPDAVTPSMEDRLAQRVEELSADVSTAVDDVRIQAHDVLATARDDATTALNTMLGIGVDHTRAPEHRAEE